MDRMSWLTRGADGLGRTFAQVPVTPAAAQPRVFAMPQVRDRFAAPGISPVSGTTFRDPGFDVGDRFAPDVPAYDYRSAFKPSFGVQRDFLFGARSQQAADPAFGSMGTGKGAGATGYGALDAHNAEFNTAMGKYGAPANLLKAMVNRESSGNWERDGNRIATFQRHDGSWAESLPFVGITKAAADAWGLDFYAMQGNKQAQIDGMAKIMAGLANQYGGWDNAVKVYFGGEDALNGNWYDENGLGSDYYYKQATDMWREFDAQSTDDLPAFKWGESGFENNSAVQAAMKYVGSAYVWGGIPGKGDPGGNWDCSGLVYWMDQNYGSGEVPMGSHYQYQWAQNTGRLTMDVNSLQPGDLLFFDTGNYAGAGADLNNAGHVGVYIGNGQMLHASNPTDGTVVSDLNAYMQMYGFLGGARTSFSGGGGGFGGGSSYDPSNWRDALRLRGF